MFNVRGMETLSLAIGLMAASVWQLTGTKRRAQNACHMAIPIQAFGRQADISCVRFGLLQGWRCLSTCWALMLVMILAGGFIWMIGISLVLYLERSSSWQSRIRHPSAIAMGFLTFLVLANNLR